MRWRWWVVVVALVAGTVAPAFTRAAQATNELVAQSGASLTPGVTYTSYVDSNPRNVIDVTRIAAGAHVAIKAVPASSDGHGATASVTTLCQQVNAVACINGDFFDSRGQPLGGELVDGHWLRSPTAVQQQLWLDTANHFSVGPMPAHAVQSLGATNYVILTPGRPIAIPEHDAFADDPHARTLVGWNGAGDGFLVTVEQGGGSAGMSLAQAAAVMQQLGATSAVNEDGGGSTQMVVAGVRHGAPGEEARAVANIWAVVALPPPAASPVAVAPGTPLRPPPPPALDTPVPPPRQWQIMPSHP